jgi:CRP-like cAMP-binding protein
MNATAQTIDSKLFKSFTPLSSLDDHTLEKLAQHAAVQRIKSGNFLFERGDTKSQTLFLLEGEIELCSPVFPTQKISANSEAGRYPLAHSFPRQFTAVSVTDVRVLILPLDILEVMQLDAAKGKTPSTGAQADAWKTQWLNSPMLRNLPDANKEALLAKMEEIQVQAGQVIIHQEEPADSYFVIKKGRCSVSRRPAPGSRDVKLAELAEGKGFGEEALITNVARNASVTMLNDGVLLRLRKQDFIALLARPLLHHLPFQNAIELVEQGAVLIDVRAPEEFEIDGLIGSLNMPLPVLRLKANRLRRDCTYIVYSNTGHFSSVAAFLLIQQGLKAYVLLGGLSSAPKYRMKRGAFSNDDGSGAQDGPASPQTVLPFPQSDNAFNPPHNGNPTNKQQTEVDWNLISDDVLWRTTIGYRKDDSVEAAIMAAPAKQETQPPIDATLQGFDDIKLFTTIHSLQDVKTGDGNEPQPIAAFTQLANSINRNDDFGRPVTQHPHGSRHWRHKPLHRPSRRFIFALAALLLLGLGGGLGYFYLMPGALSNKLEDGRPLLVEQRKLDAKMTRLLDAIESMTALQKRAKESNDTAATALPPTKDGKAESSDIAQGQILRKQQ